jgi:2,7-dihydroxy-5-methyl-1-naphthoate 7-O-methyltransferase
VADGVDLDALSDLRTPWCLRAVTTLRIAERMAQGETDVARLAEQAGCDPEALERVLGHLVSRGVFRQEGPGRFCLNAAAEQLMDPFRRFDLDLEGIGGRMAGVWSTLPEFVRSGRPAYAQAFGRGFWDDLASNPAVAASFDDLMGPAGHGAFDGDLPLAGGWAEVRSVVDVGGGTGAMLIAVLRAHPDVRGVLVDLPGTVERARAVLEAAGVAGQIELAGQSFFDPLPAGHDLYLVRKVVNDWPDPEAQALLRRCAEAARPDGRVVVIGSVSAEQGPPSLAIETVLVGGTDRTPEQFERLARSAGLEVVAAGEEASGRSVIECRPV